LSRIVLQRGGVGNRVAAARRVTRSCEPEVLDEARLPEPVVERAYRDLARLHRVLGNTGYVARAIRRDPLPVQRVLDIGCGFGHVSAEVRDRLGVEVIGIDLRPPANPPVKIVRADAVRDALPRADVAYCLCLAHHLDEAEMAGIIRNVGRSCRRFLIVDLVRHWLPLGFFRALIAPFFSRVAAIDGAASVRRAYTPAELGSIVKSTGVRYRHSVAPYFAMQSIDIHY
jgi:SAM-dependent methyltransferase